MVPKQRLEAEIVAEKMKRGFMKKILVASHAARRDVMFDYLVTCELRYYRIGEQGKALLRFLPISAGNN